MQEKFTVLIRVRYAECDMQGVVFNARYGEYVDVAATEFFRHVLGRYESMLEQNLDTQVVALNTEWKSPARFDDVLALSVTVHHVGNTSFSLQVEMLNHQTQQLVCTSEITYVQVSLPNYEKTPIPEHYKEKLNAKAKLTVVDFSGG